MKLLLPMLLAMIIPSEWSSVASQESANFTDATNAEQDRREIFRVFRIFVKSWEDVNAISELRMIARENPEIDFWLDSVQPGTFADVMVSPRGLPLFQHFLHSHQPLNVTISVDDVQKLIIRNEFRPRLHKWRNRRANSRRRARRGHQNLEGETFRRSRRGDQPIVGSPQFDQLRGVNYPFGEYSSYSSMVRYLRTLEFYYPHLVQLIQIGATNEGRSIEGVKIGLNPELVPNRNGGARVATPPSRTAKKPKRAFWIDGNMHAREWASGHTAMFIINQLVAGYEKDPYLTNALNRLDFYIIPCANPDGFEFSRSSLNPKFLIRLWRKNRSPEQCTRTWSGLLCCRGVDLNRNFDFHWAETGSSLNACSNLYAGKYAFSEPEAHAIKDFLMQEEMRGRVDAFITLHTYAQMWIHPYSHEYQFYPNDVQKLKSLALRATSRLKEIYGTSYRVGTGADLLAPASGGSDDWAKEKLGVKFVYLVELRPQLDLSNGFILRQEELLPTAIETFEAIKEVVRGVLLENGLPTALSSINGTKNESATMSLSPPISGTTPAQTSQQQQSNLTSASTSPSPSTTPALPKTSQQLTSALNIFTSTSTTTTTATTSFSPGITLSIFTKNGTSLNSPSISSTTTRQLLMEEVTATRDSQTTTTTMTREKPTTATATTFKTRTIASTTAKTTEQPEGSKAESHQNQTGHNQRFFTLPWVPTRRVSPNRARFPLGNWKPRVSVLTTSPRPSTTVLFTAVESTGHISEFELPLQTSTAPPLLRTAPKILNSAALDQFGIHRRNKDGQFSQVVLVDNAAENLLALLEHFPTTTIPITSSSTRPKRCSDEKSSCAFWIRAHPPVCAEQRRFMQRSCALSCGFCTN